MQAQLEVSSSAYGRFEWLAKEQTSRDTRTLVNSLDLLPPRWLLGPAERLLGSERHNGYCGCCIVHCALIRPGFF